MWLDRATSNESPPCPPPPLPATTVQIAPRTDGAAVHDDDDNANDDDDGKDSDKDDANDDSTINDNNDKYDEADTVCLINLKLPLTQDVVGALSIEPPPADKNRQVRQEAGDDAKDGAVPTKGTQADEDDTDDNENE